MMNKTREKIEKIFPVLPLPLNIPPSHRYKKTMEGPYSAHSAEVEAFVLNWLRTEHAPFLFTVKKYLNARECTEKSKVSTVKDNPNLDLDSYQ